MSIYKIITLLLAFLMACSQAYSQNRGSEPRVDAHVLHPKINPINPNLIAYQQGGNIKIINRAENMVPVYEISCIRDEDVGRGDTQSRDIFDVTTEDVDINETSFDCSYFEWRPVLDSSGRYWFAYTSASERSLNLGYVGENDVVLMDGTEKTFICTDYSASRNEYFENNCDHFEVYASPNGEVLNRPKWSPMGHQIIMNQGTGLYLIEGLRQVINNAAPQNVSALLLTEYAFFPEWSPDGRYLAYEYSPGFNQTRTENVQVQLLDLHDTDMMGRPLQGTPVREFLIDSNDLTDEQFKPKWSESGNYLTYMIPHVFEGQWNVRVDTVSFSDEGEIEFLDSITRGQGRYRASNVQSGGNMRSGYPVVRMANEDGVREVLLVVKNDQDRGNPILLYPLEMEAIRAGIDERAFPISNTVQNTHLNVVYDGTFTHIAYVSQEDGAFRLQTVTMNRNVIYEGEDERRPEIAVSAFPRELSRSSAFRRSMVIPGLGQFYKGERGKGLIFMGITVAALGGTAYLISQNQADSDAFSDARNEYITKYNTFLNGKLIGVSPTDLNDLYSNIDGDYGDLEDLNQTISNRNLFITASAAVLAGVYLYNLYDSRKGFPIIEYGNGRKGTVTMTPAVVQSPYSDSFAGGLKLSLNF
jgi:hypothetical protein